MDEPRGDGLLRELLSPIVESFEEVGCDRFAGFDLDGMEGVGGNFDEGIDLVAFLVSEEVECGLDAVIGLGFKEFGDHPVLEEGTALGMSGEMIGLSDSEEPGGQARVGEVEFGGFDQPLGGVCKPRTDEEDEVARFKNGEPGFGGDAGDAGIGGEGRDIHQLADAPGAELNETLESGEVLNIEDLADIALKVGSDVVLKPNGGFDRAIINWREEALGEEFVNGGRSASNRLQFSEGKRE